MRNRIVILSCLLLFPGLLRGEVRFDRQNAIVHSAKSYLGSPYRYGGNSPRGFDCSGLAQYVYAKNGISIPRSTRLQYQKLKAVKVPQKGDLLFFNTERNRISHVGIYLGSFLFIHAPSRGKRVRIDDIRSPYWKKIYRGSRSYLQKKIFRRAGIRNIDYTSSLY